MAVEAWKIVGSNAIAAARYRSALGDDEAAIASGFLAILNGRRLIYRNRPACTAIEPRFITARDYATLRQKCEVAIGLIERADRAFRARADLRDLLLANFPLRGLVEAHGDYLPEPVGRFDALLDANGDFHFIEFNAGLCGGLFIDEAVAEAIETLPPMQELRRQMAPRFEPTATAFVEALASCHLRYQHRPLRRLAFILPDGPAGDPWTDHAEIRMMTTEMARQGIEARTLRIADLDLSGSAIRAGDWQIDAACVFDWIALLPIPQAAPLLRPRTLPHSWIVNPLGAAIHRGGKHLFALLSDPDAGIIDDPAERDWIDRHIPWTRIVADQETTGPDGSRAPLIDHLRRARTDLVLKPCFSMAGRGVVLGWQASAADWEAAIAAALMEPYVVQRRIPLVPTAYTCLSAGGGAVEQMLESDLCCYVWQDGTARGLHSRLSSSGLMNVSGGGASVVPVYVVD